MSQTTKEVLNRVPTWPDEDQEELAEVAREIEWRRIGVYVLNHKEGAAIEAARRSGVASDADVAALWKRYDVAFSPRLRDARLR